MAVESRGGRGSIAWGFWREPDLGVISLQPGSEDFLNVMLPFPPVIDISVYVYKCPQPVLDTGDKRPTGQAIAFRELTIWCGGQISPQTCYYNMGRCKNHTQGTQVTRGGPH